MNKDDLKSRTKKFALGIIEVCKLLPKTQEANVVGNQLLRCATSVGANYRAVCRARSRAEFIAKLGVVIEEADESMFWLELIREIPLLDNNNANRLINEANELTAIRPLSKVLRLL